MAVLLRPIFIFDWAAVSVRLLFHLVEIAVGLICNTVMPVVGSEKLGWSKDLDLFFSHPMGSCPSRRPSCQEPPGEATEERARRRWKAATRRICHVLRIRKHWAAIGRALQEPRLQSLVEGTERRHGVITRIPPKPRR